MQQQADTTTTITDEKQIAVDNVSDGLDLSEKEEFNTKHIRTTPLVPYTILIYACSNKLTLKPPSPMKRKLLLTNKYLTMYVARVGGN